MRGTARVTAEETLLPADAFDNAYAKPDERFETQKRGPECEVITGLLTGACCGWREKPSTAEFYEAMRTTVRNARQRAIVRVLITEATTDTIALGYLDGAYTWQQLARAMHEQKHYRAELARYVNKHARRNR